MQARRYPTWAGWAVHLYTASGALFGLLALQAAAEGAVRTAFLWMAVTILIDSTDGTLARRLDVASLVPSVDGRVLDDIVDYFTYVVVPVALMRALNLLPHSIWVAAAPILASGFGFANRQAKTTDNFFLGFPSYWNIVAFHLWLFALPVWINAVAVVVLSVLVLVPTRYVYPTRTEDHRALTLVLGGLWGVQLVAAFVWPEQLPGWWLWSTLYYPVYYLALSFAMDRKLRREQQGSGDEPG